MKKYEYKYIKTEALTWGTEKSYNNDEAVLTGFGLEGWRLHSLVGAYYLMEREISQPADLE